MATEFDQHNKKLDEARRTCGITRVAGVMVIYIKWNPGTNKIYTPPNCHSYILVQHKGFMGHNTARINMKDEWTN
jgi:hypothetical protein